MRVIDSCARCLMEKQQHLSDDTDFLQEIQAVIQNRFENDSAPYLVYLFDRAYERRFGKSEPYRVIKRTYNNIIFYTNTIL